jgi:hypothetical protein
MRGREARKEPTKTTQRRTDMAWAGLGHGKKRKGEPGKRPRNQSQQLLLMYPMLG